MPPTDKTPEDFLDLSSGEGDPNSQEGGHEEGGPDADTAVKKPDDSTSSSNEKEDGLEERPDDTGPVAHSDNFDEGSLQESASESQDEGRQEKTNGTVDPVNPGGHSGDGAPAKPEAVASDVRSDEQSEPQEASERKIDVESARREEVQEKTDAAVKKEAGLADQGMQEVPQPLRSEGEPASKTEQERADIANMEQNQRGQHHKAETNTEGVETDSVPDKPLESIKLSGQAVANFNRIVRYLTRENDGLDEQYLRNNPRQTVNNYLEELQ